MKSFKLKSALVVLFLSAALISCNNDDDKVESNGTTKVAFATEVKGPATGKVNEELSYDVTFTADNACGVFSKFTETIIGTEKGFQIAVNYPSDACTLQVPSPQKAVYKFKSATKGSFDIKFRKSETEFISAKVIVE